MNSKKIYLLLIFFLSSPFLSIILAKPTPEEILTIRNVKSYIKDEASELLGEGIKVTVNYVEGDIVNNSEQFAINVEYEVEIVLKDDTIRRINNTIPYIMPKSEVHFLEKTSTGIMRTVRTKIIKSETLSPNNPKIADILIESLKDEKNDKITIIQKLANIKNEKVVTTLLNLLEDNNLEVRKAAFNVLKGFSNSKTKDKDFNKLLEEVLLNGLREKSLLAKLEIIKILGDIKSSKIVYPILFLLNLEDDFLKKLEEIIKIKNIQKEDSQFSLKALIKENTSLALKSLCKEGVSSIVPLLFEEEISKQGEDMLKIMQGCATEGLIDILSGEDKTLKADLTNKYKLISNDKAIEELVTSIKAKGSDLDDKVRKELIQYGKSFLIFPEMSVKPKKEELNLGKENLSINDTPFTYKYPRIIYMGLLLGITIISFICGYKYRI